MNFVLGNCSILFFLSPGELRHHMASAHNDGAETCVCDKCGKSFASQRSFQQHLATHQKFHMCTICERIFTSKRSLRDHLAMEHQMDCTVDDMFVCYTCKKKHVSSTDLNDHLVEHGMIKNQLCQHCDKHFVSKTLLTVHLMESHEFNPTTDFGLGSIQSMQVMDDAVQKNFKCDICGIFLSSTRTLSDHKKQVHDKANHIKCDLCDFSTYEPYRLKRHKQTKHEKIQYKYDLCDCSSTYKSSLKKHKLAKHEKIKPHQCTKCEKNFYSKQNLANHYLCAHNILYQYQSARNSEFNNQ